jgi:nucleoid DNA-binding protein
MEKIVGKGVIVHQTAKKTKMPKEDVSFMYDVMMDVIYNTLRSGTGVLLPNIASLQVVDKEGQVSNMTGQTIPPHKRLRFRPNRHLARFVRVDTRVEKIK